MADEIRVQFGSLEAGRDGIAKVHGGLLGTLSQLESDLAPMVASWNGVAQEAYVRDKTAWEQGAEQMAVTLNQIANLVGTAHENYVAAEQAAFKTWQ